LEKDLGLKKVKIYFKREDVNEIGSYKLNSSYVQAYYAAQEGIKEFIGDTGPGNWGMGMAVACKEFGIPAVIYMEKGNYDLKKDKVRVMEKYGATVAPITTQQGTIAASISVALKHVRRDPRNKLSLGCLTAYSALHNTVIGMELKRQLEQENIVPDAMLSVVGGGSSFSGLVFPFIKDYSKKTEFIAVESASVPSFTKGEYRYENPDLIGLMPRSKMYTLGVSFVPKKLGASGLNYHGKNPLLSLLVNKGVIKAVAYPNEEVDQMQSYFEKVEGIKPAAESCYAIKGAIEKAKEFNGQEKTIVFLITGNGNSLEL
jgi:predicted alternative tryptophan synthase beta-subunit